VKKGLDSSLSLRMTK